MNHLVFQSFSTIHHVMENVCKASRLSSCLLHQSLKLMILIFMENAGRHNLHFKTRNLREQAQRKCKSRLQHKSNSQKILLAITFDHALLNLCIKMSYLPQFRSCIWLLSLEVLVIVFKGKNSTLHQKNFSMVMMLLKEQVDND